MNLQFMYKVVTKIWSNGLVPFLCSLNWGGRHLAWLKSPRKLQSSQTVVHPHLIKYNETHKENLSFQSQNQTSNIYRVYLECLDKLQNFKSKFILKDQQPAHTNTYTHQSTFMLHKSTAKFRQPHHCIFTVKNTQYHNTTAALLKYIEIKKLQAGMSFIPSTYFNRAAILLRYYIFSHYEVYR